MALTDSSAPLCPDCLSHVLCYFSLPPSLPPSPSCSGLPGVLQFNPRMTFMPTNTSAPYLLISFTLQPLLPILDHSLSHPSLRVPSDQLSPGKMITWESGGEGYGPDRE